MIKNCQKCHGAGSVPFCTQCGATGKAPRAMPNYGLIAAWCFVAAIALAGLFAIWYIRTAPERNAYAQRAERFGGKPSIGRSGVASAVWRHIDQTANDPSSVQVIFADEPIPDVQYMAWRQRVRVRAKNGFGALMVYEYVFIIRSNMVIAAMDENDLAN